MSAEARANDTYIAQTNNKPRTTVTDKTGGTELRSE